MKTDTTLKIDEEKFREVCGLKSSLKETFAQMIAAGTMIVHPGVKVNRNRSPEEAIGATGRKQHVLSDSALATMPRGQGEVVDLYYMKREGFTSDNKWEQYLKELRLAPDPYAQAADNEANPCFADEHPNGTHWKNSEGEWYLVSFNRWHGERGVLVRRSDLDWLDDLWFGGRELDL